MLILLVQTTPSTEPSWLSEPGLTILSSVVASVISAIITAVVMSRIEFRKFRKEQLWQKRVDCYDGIIAALYDFSKTAQSLPLRLKEVEKLLPGARHSDGFAIILRQCLPLQRQVERLLHTSDNLLSPIAFDTLTTLHGWLGIPGGEFSDAATEEMAKDVAERVSEALEIMKEARKLDCG